MKLHFGLLVRHFFANFRMTAQHGGYDNRGQHPPIPPQMLVVVEPGEHDIVSLCSHN